MDREKAADTAAVYVRRDSDGRILSVSRAMDDLHKERCAAGHPDVSAFVRRLSGATAQLAESDLSLIRAIEDVIDVLIKKEVLRLTDLPEKVQEKLVLRRQLRGSLLSLNLLDDDPGLGPDPGE